MIDIAKIHEQLPFGAQTEIAKRANVNLSLVHRVLKGKSTDMNVLNTVADYLTELKSKEQEVANKFASLIQ